MRRLAVAASAVLVASACAKVPEGAATYEVGIDLRSAPKKQLQFAAYFPAELTVAPGDSVAFRNDSTRARHTVTFGVKADRMNQPAPYIGGVRPNRAVFRPCHIPVRPTRELKKCEFTKLRRFDGTGYWNSGALRPGKTVTLEVSKDTRPGDYAFSCLLHPFMSGRMSVTTDLRERSTRRDVRAAAGDDRARARSDTAPIRPPRSGSRTVLAGWGTRLVSVNRFAPSKVTIDPGERVAWRIESPNDLHTVNFDTKALAASGPGPGGFYYGGPSSSGLLGPKGTRYHRKYSITFMQPGTYRYSCALHPGQVGYVKVRPYV